MAEVKTPETSCIPLKHAKVLKGPSQIAFDITNRCNYRCLHCFNLSGENLIVKDELSDEEVIEFIKDIAELKPINLCFCGGEPLLREDVLCKAAKILSSRDIMVSLVTNGSLITKETAKRLLTNGVSRVQVSLDGAKPETHEKLRRYKGAFKYAINAITYFKGAGHKSIDIAFTPTSFNYYELERTYHLCMKLGATSFRVQPLMILGRAQLCKEILPSPLHYRYIVRTINKLHKENGISIEWGDPIDHLIRFRTLLRHCVNFANIKADGGIEISPYLPLTVGNVRRHSFSEYWNAGLARIWEIPKIKELASRIVSISDFEKKDEEIPTVWFEEDIKLDLIDDHLFKGDESCAKGETNI